MDASIYYRIQNATKSRYRIDNAERGLQIMGTSSLRVVGAMYTLQQFLEEREEISNKLEQYLDEHTDDWGIKVE